ncbi:hypothetical protein Flav3CDRAFT_0585 [Flavobacteria bacterium MS024-3C]|nr:hypothetical protein Flav3CDRAFT_0585 [Flavobacteria bacterium MS024-3C]
MKNTIKTLAFTVLVLSSIASKAQQQPNFLVNSNLFTLDVTNEIYKKLYSLMRLVCK